MNFLIKIRYFIEFFLFKIILFLLQLLSKKTSSKIMSKFFLFLGRLSKYNQIAKNNCRIVFPYLNEMEIKNIINNSWENLGHNLFEITYLNKLVKEKNTIEIKGREILDNIKNDGFPVIFFSIHSSNWEICVPLLDHIDFQIGAVYRHLNNNFFNRYIYKKRTNALKTKNSFYAPKGKESAKKIIEGIIKNKDLEWSQRDHGIFIGYGPINDPKFSISVLIEHGGSGSGAAAPIAKNVMNFIFKNKLNIERNIDIYA